MTPMTRHGPNPYASRLPPSRTPSFPTHGTIALEIYLRSWFSRAAIRAALPPTSLRSPTLKREYQNNPTVSLHLPIHAPYPFFFFLFILPWPFHVLTTTPSTPTSTQSGRASASAKSSKNDASRQIPSNVFLLSTIGIMTCAFFAL